MVSSDKIRRARYAVLFVAVWLFIRFGFGRITTTFDEAYYLSTIKIGGVYSGLVTPYLLRLSSLFLGNPVHALLAVSLILFVAYPFLILGFHRRMGYSGSTIAFLLALLLSSHYLWSSNEVRPQQIGLLIGMWLLLVYSSAIEEEKGFTSKWRYFLLTFGWVGLAFAHVFSLAITLSLVWVMMVWGIVRGSVGLRESIFLLFPSVAGFSLPLFLPQYDMTVFSVKWMLKHSSFPLLREIGWHFTAFYLAGLIALILSVPVVALVEIKAGFLRRTSDFVALELRKRTRLYLLLGVFFMLLAMVVQISLGRATYADVYKNSFDLLFLMQLGNITFNVLLLLGVVGAIKERRITGPVVLTLFLALLGAVALAFSTVMPKGFGSFGFTNWMVRVYQYLVVFGAPLVAEEIETLLPSRVVARKALTVFLLAGIVTTVLNVSRTPTLYNYPYYWTGEDLRLVPQVGPGFFYLRGSCSVPDNSQALNFLGWAYGVNIKPAPESYGSLQPDLCVGSLCHSPYPYVEVPILSVNFDNLTVTPGSVPKSFAEWTAGLLKDGLEGHGGAFLLLGNSTLNPTVAHLEQDYLLPVSVNYSIIEGPTFRYYYAIKEGRKKGDVSRSYFVIQAVEINGSKALVISAPSLDGVAAGAWFLSNVMLPNPSEWENVSWVVGEWKEKDGRVLPFLRAFEGDTNGFSLGDEIRVVNKGTVGKP